MLNEKERSSDEALYDANDASLILHRNNCKELCYKFNNLSLASLSSLSSKNGPRQIIKELFGKTGVDFHITAPFWCDYGYNIEVGENFYTNHNCVILDGAKVKFGNNVLIAPNCCISTAGHPLDFKRRNAGLEYAYPITIGDNVWIGANVTILPGVTVGDNTVIGAGSVVNKDIPSNVVAAGNPCRIIREIS